MGLGRPALRVLGLSLALTLPGCRKPPAELLREATESGHSWIQGADMAADLWTRGLAPGGFTRIAIQDAQKGLEAERARLGRSADVLRDARVAEAVRVLDAASVAASRLAAALPRDRGEVAAAREALRAADRDLQAGGNR
jgi:hypothetical protein